MFIDSSAVVAVLGREPEQGALEARIGAAASTYVSPIVIFESAAALARMKSKRRPHEPLPQSLVEQARQAVAAFIDDGHVESVAITPEIGAIAIDAFAKYGKGVGHPAKLNLADCFSYACAKTLGVPLLYKGDDFSKTDIA